jgi:3-oxoacyl-(acyl-carrier-protein) synthase
MRETVVSGYSAITPLGDDRRAIAAALRAGVPALVPRHFPTAKGTPAHGTIGFDFAAERAALEREARPLARVVSDTGLLALRVVERLLAEHRIDTGGLAAARVACIGASTAVDSPYATWEAYRENAARADLFHYNKQMPSSTSAVMGPRFGFRGPCFNVAMAQGGAGAALLVACALLETGRIDVAIVFASCVQHEQPLLFNSLARFGGISPSGRIAFASAGRDGFVTGDAGVAVLLETAEHARARGARPRFLVRGVEASNDGRDCFVPDAGGMARVHAALSRATGRVDYINPHGAGTKVGDPVEVQVIRDAHPHGPLVNSTKAYSGHAMEACFLQELVHTFVQMEEGFVAATPHTQELDAECANINLVRGRAVETRIERAICHNLGLGGGNVAVAVEAA